MSVFVQNSDRFVVGECAIVEVIIRISTNSNLTLIIVKNDALPNCQI